jgi:hypothetical protein
MSFDLDQKTVRTDPSEIRQQRHVFIAGLARAGTTILMRRFHNTGHYRSLTYRDMPFVLAPNLWHRVTSLSRHESGHVERAHGDKLLVNVDSPESLDEVFWRIFTGNEYIKNDRLIPYEPAAEIIRKFVHYVNAILSTPPALCKRYLSKNNNNILRLGAIHRAFPNALLLIPFREPLQHAHSLLRQHRRFSELQSASAFTLSYMNWLCHHEFGLGHRPVLPNAIAPPRIRPRPWITGCNSGAKPTHGWNMQNRMLRFSYAMKISVQIKRTGIASLNWQTLQLTTKLRTRLSLATSLLTALLTRKSWTGQQQFTRVWSR